MCVLLRPHHSIVPAAIHPIDAFAVAVSDVRFRLHIVTHVVRVPSTDSYLLSQDTGMFLTTCQDRSTCRSFELRNW